MTLYQNCSNSSASLNKMAARAINRNKLLTTSSAISMDRFWNNFTGMFLRWLSTKIAQTVPLHWTRWPPELKIEKPLNDFFSLTSASILKKIYRKVPWVTLYQNCSNRSAPLNKMAARAKNRKTYKRFLLLNQKMDFEIIILECFLGDPLPKLLQPFRYVDQNGRQGYK